MVKDVPELLLDARIALLWVVLLKPPEGLFAEILEFDAIPFIAPVLALCALDGHVDGYERAASRCFVRECLRLEGAEMDMIASSRMRSFLIEGLLTNCAAPLQCVAHGPSIAAHPWAPRPPQEMFTNSCA